MIRDARLPPLLRMALDPKVWRLLRWLHRELAGDPDYSFVNLLRSFRLLIRDSKVVPFNGKYVLASFMPPVPSEAFRRMIRATPGKNSRFHELTHSIRTAPVSTHIAVTTRCPNACAYCSADRGKPAADMSRDMVRTLIADLQDMGVALIGITGGEPLLREDLAEIVSFIDQRSTAMLFTSGHGLTPARARDLRAAGLFGVAVSVDGCSRDAGDRVKGRAGAHEDARAAVAACLGAGLYTMLQSVLRPQATRQEALALVELARLWGVHEIRFLDQKAAGRAASADSLVGHHASPGTMDAALSKVLTSRAYPKVTFLSHTESASQLGCVAAALHAYVGVDGSLHPCDFVERAYGNVKDTSVAQLWRGMRDDLSACDGPCMAMRTRIAADAIAKTAGGDARRQLPGFFRRLAGAECAGCC